MVHLYLGIAGIEAISCLEGTSPRCSFGPGIKIYEWVFRITLPFFCPSAVFGGDLCTLLTIGKEALFNCARFRRCSLELITH